MVPHPEASCTHLCIARRRVIGPTFIDFLTRHSSREAWTDSQLLHRQHRSFFRSGRRK